MNDLFKIKLVFPLPETRGFTVREAVAFAVPLIGEPTYTEKFEGEIDYFDYRVPGEEGFRTEANTWSVEKVDMEEDTWGLSFCFTHGINRVDFGISTRDLLRKTLKGNFLLGKRGLKPRVPILAAYPFNEEDDEPVLSELRIWRSREKP